MTTDTIQKQIELRAPLRRVWQALSDSTQFGIWFGVKFQDPFTPGANMHGIVTPTKVNPDVAKAQTQFLELPFEITIEEMIPERLFSFRWHPFAIDRSVDYSAEPTTLVVFELQDVGGITHLTVTESGFDQIPLERRVKAFTANEKGWATVTNLLEKYLSNAG